MPKVIERPGVVGPTGQESVLDMTYLKPQVSYHSDDHQNPFLTFDDRKAGWLRQGLSPELMTRAAQYFSGIVLSEHALVNLYGWAREELARSQGVLPSPDNPGAVDEFINAAEQGER